MTASLPRPRPLARLLRRKIVWLLASIPLIALAAGVLLTAPLEPPSPSTSDPAPRPEPTPTTTTPPPSKPRLADWPEAPLEGEAAKVLSLASLLVAKERLEASGGYSAVFRKTERAKGVLGKEQVLEMKCRRKPFAVYLKFRTPEPGKEVVFSSGHYDDHVIAHGVGISRKLVPRLKVTPETARTITGDRHPITEAGLFNLTDRLIKYRKMDLNDPEARTVLDRTTDDQGRPRLRSRHTHLVHKDDRPFEMVEVLHDPATRIPVSIRSYDWLSPGESGEPKLAEVYRYDDLKLDLDLSDLDFDPANPAYEFTRF